MDGKKMPNDNNNISSKTPRKKRYVVQYQYGTHLTIQSN